MAFTVTPTSGASPYTFEAQFSNAINIDGIHFSLEFLRAQVSGACPTDANTYVPVAGAASALLATGTFVAVSSAPVGSCQGSRLIIRNMSTGAIVSQEEVFINNV